MPKFVVKLRPTHRPGEDIEYVCSALDMVQAKQEAEEENTGYDVLSVQPKREDFREIEVVLRIRYDAEECVPAEQWDWEDMLSIGPGEELSVVNLKNVEAADEQAA